MLQVILFSLLIITISLVLLAVRLFFGKRFINTHVDGSKALTAKGIHCAQTQDAEMRQQRRTAINERSH